MKIRGAGDQGHRPWQVNAGGENAYLLVEDDWFGWADPLLQVPDRPWDEVEAFDDICTPPRVTLRHSPEWDDLAGPTVTELAWLDSLAAAPSQPRSKR
jgi:hypothetical protein